MAYKLKVGPAQGLKLKGNAGFALPLLGGDAISTTKTGGLWRVDIDYSEVQTGSTVNDATAYMLTWDSASGLFTRLNVTDLKVEFQGTFDGYYQPLDATLTSLAALDSTVGLLVQTGADTFARRTLTGTANEITVTNGAGTAGNPTVSLPAALTFTGKTVTGGTFQSPAINTPTGIVKGDVGLGNVDNTSDATKNAASATLTNKTIDTAGPNTIKINGNTLAASAGTATVTVPNATDTLVGKATTDTLTNKTISGASNTLSNIGNSSLTNSSMTIAGHLVSLGGSQAIAVGDLSSIADGTIASNVSGAAAAPAANSISSVLDKLFGTAQGTIAYRDVAGWSALTPGTSGQFLKTLGASANPAWDSIPGGGDMLSTNNLSDVANADTSRLNIAAASAATIAKSSAYTVVATDAGSTVMATAALTLSLTAAATLGANFMFDVVNAASSNGVVTIDPNGSETINGALTLKIFPGERATVVCGGSNWSAFGLSPLVLLSTQTVSAVSSVSFVSLFDTTFSSFEVRGNGLILSASNADLQLVVSANAGSSWYTGATDYKLNYVVMDQGGTLSGASTDGANISTCQLSSASMSSFEMELFDLNSTTSYKTTQQRQAGTGTGGLRFMASSARMIGAGINVVNGLQYKPSSGTMSGTFKLYGRR